ncbi:hypothetical protein ACUNHZ_08780 [Serratia sp. IR-2025]
MKQTLTTTEELKHLASSDNANELTRRLARECLANREAQPVALVDRRPAASGGICWQHGGKDLPHGTELFTAPPAPAVPEEMTIEQSYENVQTWHYANGWNACRAAMLAQPVSSGYTFNSPVIPDGWKLVPIDATRAMIDAAQRVEEDGYDAMHKEMLAAVPEGGK